MHETNLADWDHLPNGDLEVLPLASFEAGAAAGLVLLRLEILVGPGQLGTAQISIPSDRAAELGKVLSWLALRSTTSTPEQSA